MINHVHLRETVRLVGHQTHPHTRADDERSNTPMTAIEQERPVVCACKINIDDDDDWGSSRTLMPSCFSVVSFFLTRKSHLCSIRRHTRVEAEQSRTVLYACLQVAGIEKLCMKMMFRKGRSSCYSVARGIFRPY